MARFTTQYAEIAPKHHCVPEKAHFGGLLDRGDTLNNIASVHNRIQALEHDAVGKAAQSDETFFVLV